ncbi:MAG: PIN domain nuclease [Akkermansiaceae bacterium]|nr:PIN domain nuclease [Akkermansiaceae bacterium]NNM30100.1 PIN domain nuclease [Akkermansiaceae bacterium]
MKKISAPTSVNVARLTYLLVCELAGVAVAVSSKNTALEVPLWTGVVGGLVVAGFFIFVETLMKGFSLRGFSTATFGILVGLFCAWLLTRVNIDRLLIEIMGLDSEAAETMKLAVDVSLFASLGFLGAVLALRSGRDEFAFIIPYVRFRQDAASGQPLLLDADVVMDGRVPRILASGFLNGRLIVPRFVLEELQVFANSPSPGKRQRGQRGLDCLEEMQADPAIRVTIHDAHDAPATDGMDARLVQLARILGARLLTTDENLAKVARLQNAEVLNISDLADALKPAVVVGEKIHLALVRPGKDEHQAVGYLPDGTMIVVNHGAPKIGTTQDVIVISTLQTSAGQMVFAELYDPEEAAA